jgi:hypothetical protein
MFFTVASEKQDAGSGEMLTKRVKEDQSRLCGQLVVCQLPGQVPEADSQRQTRWTRTAFIRPNQHSGSVGNVGFTNFADLIGGSG